MDKKLTFSHSLNKISPLTTGSHRSLARARDVGDRILYTDQSLPTWILTVHWTVCGPMAIGRKVEKSKGACRICYAGPELIDKLLNSAEAKTRKWPAVIVPNFFSSIVPDAPFILEKNPRATQHYCR